MRKLTFFLISLGITFLSCTKDKSDETNTICKDVEGYEYKTVKIGTQVWMAENLKLQSLGMGMILLILIFLGIQENQAIQVIIKIVILRKFTVIFIIGMLYQIKEE